MMVPIQQQFVHYWGKQRKSQRIVLVALVVAAIVLVPVLVNWATTPTFSVAYSGLSEADAGQIVQKMDEQKIAYKLSGSGTILVASDQVYEARLKMAREGLPKTSKVGYELFSGNTLGMTDFTQRVNYQRALEGELERTIGSLQTVEGVRVHVVTPEKSLFANDQTPTTASVTIQEAPGNSLDSSQVRAITHLVASSVEGLQPENVVVVDSNGNMLAGGGASEKELLLAQSDNQRSTEMAAAAEVRKRVQAMLDRALGPNRSIVQVSVAMDWTQKELTSNTYEADPNAVRSSQKIVEAYNGAETETGGVPGAGSNLPTPLPLEIGELGANGYLRTEETVNYEISQVQTHEIITPGQIKRMSVSVMVDGVDDGQINTIKSSVAAAAGLDELRGDQLVVESIAFDNSHYDTQVAVMEQSKRTDLYIQIGLAAAAVVVLAMLIGFFSKMIGNLRSSSREAWKPIMLPAKEMALQPGLARAQVGPGMSSPGLHKNATNTGLAKNEGVSVEINSRYTAAQNAEDEQRTKIITRLAEENPATVAEIIQIWLTEDSKSHG